MSFRKIELLFIAKISPILKILIPVRLHKIISQLAVDYLQQSKTLRYKFSLPFNYILSNFDRDIIYPVFEQVSCEIKRNYLLEYSFLFTSDNGLFIYKKGAVYRLLRGNCFFGLTKGKSRWYLVHTGKYGFNSQIISFKVDSLEGNAFDFKEEAFIPSGYPHQLSYIGGKLYLADPDKLLRWENHLSDKRRKNFLTIMNISDNGKVSLFKRIYMPGYKPSTFIEDNHPNHVNMIYKYKKHYYIMYQNETVKTSRKSQLVILNDNFKLHKVKDMDMCSAHNIAVYNDKFIFLDSGNSLLFYGNKKIKIGEWLRGLAINDNHFIIGSSMFTTRDSTAREKLPSEIIICEHKNMKTVNNIYFNGNVGGIREIRLLDGIDYAAGESP